MPVLPVQFQDLASQGTLGLLVGIVLFSYVLEDGALIGAAVLAATGVLAPWPAWGAAFTGIVTGDIGVYLGARLLRKPVSRWRPDLPMPTTRELVICRFTPGLRTLAYGWCGLSRMPLWRFSQIVFGSGLVWTGLVFTLVYRVGAQAQDWLGYYTWLIVPVVLTLLWWWHGRWRPAFLSTESASHD